MIKPEDIPPELVEHYLRSCVTKSWTEKIARDLNAAIQAGVVSPPCYCVRWDGELQTHDKACPGTGSIQPRVYAGKPFSHDTEHYRGQTE